MIWTVLADVRYLFKQRKGRKDAVTKSNVVEFRSTFGTHSVLLLKFRLMEMIFPTEGL